MNKLFGSQLKELRVSIGLTMNDVFERAGISTPYLSQLENDKINKPSTKTLHSLAKVYGVPITQILSICGYIENDNEIRGIKNDALSRYVKSFSDAEVSELLDYAKFIHWKKHKISLRKK